MNQSGAAKEITALCWKPPSAGLRYSNWWVWKRGQGRKCALGHFSVEEGRFNLASAEGDFRQPVHVAVRLEAVLWSVSKAGDWTKDGRDVSAFEGAVVKGDDSCFSCPPNLKERKEGFERESFSGFLCGCLGGPMWFSHIRARQGWSIHDSITALQGQVTGDLQHLCSKTKPLMLTHTEKPCLFCAKFPCF